MGYEQASSALDNRRCIGDIRQAAAEMTVERSTSHGIGLVGYPVQTRPHPSVSARSIRKESRETRANSEACEPPGEHMRHR